MTLCGNPRLCGFPQAWKSLRLSHISTQARRRSTMSLKDSNKKRGLQEVKTEILIVPSLRQVITIPGIGDHDPGTGDHDQRNTQYWPTAMVDFTSASHEKTGCKWQRCVHRELTLRQANQAIAALQSQSVSRAPNSHHGCYACPELLDMIGK